MHQSPEETGGARAEDPTEHLARLASRYNDVERFDLAEREAKRGLVGSPESPELLFELARSHFGRTQWKQAGEVSERLLEVDPESPVALRLMAIVRSHQGGYGEAERLLLDALRLAPEWAPLYESYGDLMHRTGHEAKAVRLYERARSLDPDQADLHAKLALVEAGRNRVGRAEHHARKGLRIDPGEGLAHASLGTAMLKRGRPFAARSHLREALRIDPGNDSYEEAWLEADRYCRVVYLPMYYWNLLLLRLPGRQFMVWGVFVLFLGLSKSAGVPPAVVGVVVLGYVGICVYTWVATPLLKLWLRLRPPSLDEE